MSAGESERDDMWNFTTSKYLQARDCRVNVWRHRIEIERRNKSSNHWLGVLYVKIFYHWLGVPYVLFGLYFEIMGLFIIFPISPS